MRTSTETLDTTGYKKEDFKDAFARYLEPIVEKSVTPSQAPTDAVLEGIAGGSTGQVFPTGNDTPSPPLQVEF